MAFETSRTQRRKVLRKLPQVAFGSFQCAMLSLCQCSLATGSSSLSLEQKRSFTFFFFRKLALNHSVVWIKPLWCHSYSQVSDSSVSKAFLQLFDSLFAALFFILCKHEEGPTKPQLQLETKTKCRWKWNALFNRIWHPSKPHLKKKKKKNYRPAWLSLHVESSLFFLEDEADTYTFKRHLH